MDNSKLVKSDDMMLYIVTGNTTGATAVVAFATSANLNIDSETIDVSNKMSCKWASNISGKNSYSISADALYSQVVSGTCVGYDYLFSQMVENKEVKWILGTPTSGDCESASYTFALDGSAQHYEGKGYITSLGLTTGKGDIASFSCTITGAGAVEKK